MKVFLGGTCNNSKWREKFIPMLNRDIEYFNPVVEDWTEEDMKEERIQRAICDICLYVITPSMKGVYSIAEVIDDSNKRPNKTVFCVLEKEPDIDSIKFGKSQLKSLNQVGEMVVANGAAYFKNLEEVSAYINRLYIIANE